MHKIHFDIIDSTNTYIKNNYKELEDMSFVSTSLQTKGRGRTNRIWESNKDENLLFSILIKNKNLFNKYKSLSIISAYTILQILNEYGINDLAIKWPNDLYVNDYKICGILLESVIKKDIECLIIGIGINVNQVNYDGEYIIKPISMKKILNKDIDLEELKKLVYEKFELNINKLINDYDFYDEIIKYDYLKNKVVYMNINNEINEVDVIGIDRDYSLKIKVNDEILNVDSGEVSFHK